MKDHSIIEDLKSKSAIQLTAMIAEAAVAIGIIWAGLSFMICCCGGGQ